MQAITPALVALLLMCQHSLVLPADARTTLYAGIATGRVTVRLDNAATASDLSRVGFGTTAVSADNKDAAWKFVAGVRLRPNVALEGTFAPSGEVEQHTTLVSFAGAPIPPTALTIRYRTKETFTASIVTLLTPGPFAAYGKLGLYTTKLSAKGIASTIGFSLDESVKANGALVGLGILYGFTESLSLRGEWERFLDVGKNGVIRESDVDILSLGVLYHFR